MKAIVTTVSYMLAVGCGGPLLEAGIYDVTTIQAEDSCGYRQADLNHPIWYIDYVKNHYGIRHANGDTISGYMQGKKIYFAKTEWEADRECRYTIDTSMILVPDGGDYFTGELWYNISADCTENTCNILWMVEGSKREEEEDNYHNPIYDRYPGS